MEKLQTRETRLVESTNDLTKPLIPVGTPATAKRESPTSAPRMTLVGLTQMSFVSPSVIFTTFGSVSSISPHPQPHFPLGMPIPFDRIHSHVRIAAALCQSETFCPRKLQVVPTLIIRIPRSATAKAQSYKHQKIGNPLFHIL